MRRNKAILFQPVLRHLPSILVVAALAFFCCRAFGQQPATMPAAEQPIPGRIQEHTYYELFRAGGPFMYLLLASSVLAVAIIIERFISLRRGHVIPGGFTSGLKAVVRKARSDTSTLLDYCTTHDSSIARITAAGVKHRRRGAHVAEKAMEDAAANEALRLRRNMRLLYAIGSVATLLGLIGTISGMIKAFQVASGGGLGKSELLAKGIYEAMVNTFGGLAVAIVCTGFYYFLLGRIERMFIDLNDEMVEINDCCINTGSESSEESLVDDAGERSYAQVER